MIKKNGFTLVELIAVIAVLGVLLIIVIPNIVDMFNDSKKDAFIRQVQSLWKQAEKDYAEDLADGTKNSIYSSAGTKLKVNKDDITYLIQLDKKGNISYIAVGDKEYCYISSNGQSIDINRNVIYEGRLTCDGTTCTCS